MLVTFIGCWSEYGEEDHWDEAFKVFLEQSHVLILPTNLNVSKPLLPNEYWKIDVPLKYLINQAVVPCVDPCSESLLSIVKFLNVIFLWCHSWVAQMWRNQWVGLFYYLCGSHNYSTNFCCSWWSTKRLSKKSGYRKTNFYCHCKVILSIIPFQSFGVRDHKYLLTFFLSPSIVERISQRSTRISS